MRQESHYHWLMRVIVNAVIVARNHAANARFALARAHTASRQRGAVIVTASPTVNVAGSVREITPLSRLLPTQRHLIQETGAV